MENVQYVKMWESENVPVCVETPSSSKISDHNYQWGIQDFS